MRELVTFPSLSHNYIFVVEHLIKTPREADMSVDKMPTTTFALTGDMAVGRVGSAEVPGQLCKRQHFIEECFS